MKKTLSTTIAILSLSVVASLHAYTSQIVTNTVQSLIDGPAYFTLQGQTLSSPLSQYGAFWSGELLLATNGTFTGEGVIISFVNGSTNSTRDSFKLVSSSSIKGPVLLESYNSITNLSDAYNTYGDGNTQRISYKITNVSSSYVYSADCILIATNKSGSFLMKGRAQYEVNVNKSTSPKVVTPSYVQNGYTIPPYTNNAYTNIYTNSSVYLNVAAFSSNNTFWGILSAYSRSTY